jgi:hypothetical protein
MGILAHEGLTTEQYCHVNWVPWLGRYAQCCRLTEQALDDLQVNTQSLTETLETANLDVRSVS